MHSTNSYVDGVTKMWTRYWRYVKSEQHCNNGKLRPQYTNKLSVIHNLLTVYTLLLYKSGCSHCVKINSSWNRSEIGCNETNPLLNWMTTQLIPVARIERLVRWVYVCMSRLLIIFKLSGLRKLACNIPHINPLTTVDGRSQLRNIGWQLHITTVTSINNNNWSTDVLKQQSFHT